MAFDPLTAITNLIDKGLDKFVADKIPEAEKIKLQNDMQKFVMTEARKSGSAFRQFVLDYEGAASEHGPFIKWLRGVIRPVLTIAISGAYIWGWTSPETWTDRQMELLNPAFLIVLAFWFGERAIRNTGIVDVILKRKNSQ